MNVKTRALQAALLASVMALATAAHAQTVKIATSLGDITVQLEAAKAPKTVENFLQYAKAGQIGRAHV